MPKKIKKVIINRNKLSFANEKIKKSEKKGIFGKYLFTFCFGLFLYFVL